MKIGRTIARLLIGGLFVGHGLQKTHGKFGGHGPDGTGGFFESLGLKPGKRNALAAGYTEVGGGALLASGFAAPAAAAGLIGTMIVAIRTVHGPKGPWATDGGWEYNAVLIAALLTIVDEGDGPLAALAALAAGAAGSELVLRAARAAGDGTSAESAQQTPTGSAPVAEPV